MSLFQVVDKVFKYVLRLKPQSTVRYDTTEEFNVDWKADHSALSSTRSQKKKLKQTTQCPFDTVQVKIREGSPEGIRVTMDEKSKQ